MERSWKLIYERKSKLLVSTLITPIILPYKMLYIISFKEFGLLLISGLGMKSLDGGIWDFKLLKSCNQKCLKIHLRRCSQST